MSKRVIVLGAGGRFGRAAVNAFKDGGWIVTAVTRNASSASNRNADDHVACNVMDKEGLIDACASQNVIINAVNPPYEDWAELLPTITENVIAAARASGATVCIPGNVYVYGDPIVEVLREDTPHSGTTKKGQLRIEMEKAYRDAASQGLRTIILRCGDFIDGKDTGNWFETYITNSISKGKITYPGPKDQPHAWAYLPDMARAMVQLAEKRNEFEAYEEFGFEGYTLAGSDIARIAGEESGREVRIARFPWFAVRMMALFSRNIREVLEMRYLWEQPHRIDGCKLRSVLPEFEPTPEETAIGKALAQIGAACTPPVSSVKNSSRPNGQAQPDPAQ